MAEGFPRPVCRASTAVTLRVSAGRSPVAADRVKGAVLRANPDYELVPLERLPANERSLVVPEASESDVYRVFRPRQGSGLPTRAVTLQEIALLLLTLQKPGPPPHYFVAAYGEMADDTLAALILDGLLQLKTGSVFACGPEAHRHLDIASRDSGEGLLSRLSMEALQYAQALDAESVLALAARLYCFNRVPLSPRWCREIPTPEAAVDFLGLSSEKGVGPMLARHWQRVGRTPAIDQWFIWRSAQADTLPSGESPRYKLYL